MIACFDPAELSGDGRIAFIFFLGVANMLTIISASGN